jgi:hypothetical protein
VPTKGILEIAKGAVPEHVRKSGKLVTEAGSRPEVLMAFKAGRRGPKASPRADVVARLARKLGVKTRTRVSPQSGDVEFTEETRVGKRSIVVQVRGGKVKQVIKRAVR